MAAFGLRLDGQAPAAGDGAPVFWLWPQNQRALQVWLAVGTQWRTGWHGATGLDYCAVESALRMCCIPRRQWPELFGDVRAMESAALGEMRSKRG